MNKNAAKCSGAMVERKRREALTLRTGGSSYQAIADDLGISKQRAHQLVQEALKAVPSESMEVLRDIVIERLDAYVALAHDGATLLAPLRDKHGYAVLDDDGRPIMVPPDVPVMLAFINTAAKLTFEKAKFVGVGAPERSAVEHTGTIETFLFPIRK